MALMASSSRSGNALKNFATFTAAKRLRGAWGEWESLMAWTNASLLCAGDELASGSEDRVSGGGGKWDRRTTEFVGGPRRSARAKSSTAWRSCSAILGGIIIPALVVVVVVAAHNNLALQFPRTRHRHTPARLHDVIITHGSKLLSRNRFSNTSVLSPITPNASCDVRPRNSSSCVIPFIVSAYAKYRSCREPLISRCRTSLRIAST